jgi:hypothetical protein
MMKSLVAVMAACVLFVATAPLAASAAPHDFTITNNTSQSIEYVQISPPSNTRWGDDWLDADEVLSPGNSRTFSVTQGCVEDVKVTWMDHHSREWRSFDTCQYDLNVQYQ